MSDMEQHFTGQISEQPNINGHVPSASEIRNTDKMIKPPVSLGEIDSLLSFLPESPTVKEADTTRGEVRSTQTETVSPPDDVDLLLQDLDQAIDGSVKEIKGWDVEKKRLEARQTTDTFALEILATDENPLVRTLAFCNPNMPSEQLRKMGGGENKWFQMIAANNASTPVEVLDELAASQVQDIRQAVKHNPTTSPVTLHKLQN